MKLVKILAISAIAFGAPVLTDTVGLTDSASAQAKGNGNGGGNGGGNSGGNGGGNGGGKGNSGGKGSDSKGNSSDSKGKSAGKGNGNGNSKSAKGGNRKSLGEILGLKPKSNNKAAKATTRASKPAEATTLAGKPAKAKVRPATGPTVQVSARPPKQKPVQAQLKGLNSLNRNINGLMNSNDPKMDGFRAYVAASAILAADQAALEDALETFGPTLDAYGALLDALDYETPSTQEEFDALQGLLTEQANVPEPTVDDFTDEDGVFDEAAYDDAVTQWSAETVAANSALEGYDEAYDAFASVSEAQGAVDEGLEATSDAALTQAIVDGWNATGAGPATDADVTPEVLGWVSEKLGVGEDQNGLIDDFIAQQPVDPETDPLVPVMDEALADDLIEDASGTEGLVEES